jgi:hypothetical protein
MRSWGGTKVRVKHQGNSRNPKAGETRHDVRHLGDGEPDPNSVWPIRVWAWIGEPRMPRNRARRRKLSSSRETSSAVPVVRQKVSEPGRSWSRLPQAASLGEVVRGVSIASELGQTPGKGARGASSCLPAKLARSKNPRHRLQIWKARTLGSGAEVHRGRT